MAEQELNYEQRVEALMEQWNCLIDELNNAKRFVAASRIKPYDDAIDSLILLREATRRGLVEVEEAEDVLGSGVPSTETGEGERPPEAEVGLMERVLQGDLDVMESPRTRYGQEG